MPATIRKVKPTKKQEEVIEGEPVVEEHITTAAIDEMLDEIDAVLEENAEEFIRNYVQKGGE